MNTSTPLAEKVGAERKRGHGGDGCRRGGESPEAWPDKGWPTEELGDELRRRRSWPPDRRELLSLSLNSFDLALVCSLSLPSAFPLFGSRFPPQFFFPAMVPARRLYFPHELARASKIAEGGHLPRLVDDLDASNRESGCLTWLPKATVPSHLGALRRLDDAYATP
jgi:hypothetical protein